MDTTPLITVPMPTVTGREDYLAAAIKSYTETANTEVLVFTDLDGCGAGWAEGIAAGAGEYFHMGADDVEMHPGWWQAAQRVIDYGFLPAARILNTDGTLQSCGRWGEELPDGMMLSGPDDFTRAPTFSRAQWEKLQPLVEPFLRLGTHYYTDNIFTWAGNRVGIPTVVCRGFEYTHHLADVKRGAGMSWEDRMRHDHQLFIEYINS